MKKAVLLFWGLLSAISGFSQKEAPKLENYIWERYFNGGKDIVKIEADGYYGFYRNCLILRNKDQYAVMGISGNIIVPYGKYIFDLPNSISAIGKYDAFNPYYGLVVRSPESGLYGMINIKKPEKELIACKYISLTNYFNYIDGAIGERYDENGVKQKFFISMDGKEFPYRKGIVFDPKKPSRFVRIENIGNNKYNWYDIWSDSVYFKTHRLMQYYGFDLFRIDSSFNGLDKFAFVNHEGNIAIPYQINHSFRMSPFFSPGVNESNFTPGRIYAEGISILLGNNGAHYKYALMNTKGEIFAQIREKEEFNRIDLPKEEIIGGYIYLVAAKAGYESSDYLWDVHNNKFIRIQELFEKGYSDQLKLIKNNLYSFKYIDRNEYGILFHFSTRHFLPIDKVKYMYPDATPYIPGGFDGGKLAAYVFSGYGLMDYTGKITIPPVFKKLELPDIASGLAYAEMIYGKKLYKGFVHHDLGQFEFLFK